MTDMSKHASKRSQPWLLFIIAIPAAVEVWACWVGLGSLCGFPKLGRLSTNWTLAIGMEAYGAYALRVWLGNAPGQRSRTFAQWSALGAFMLSLIGQIAYHLMLANGMRRAPDAVIVFVACLLVVVLAFAAILTHLMHADERAAINAGEERSMQTRLAAERDARLQAEADRDTARAEAADTAARAEAALRQPAGRHKDDAAARRKIATATRKSAAKDPEAQAAEIVTHAEAELILTAEPDISGSELGRRLGTTPGYGRTLKRKLTQVGSGGED
jgi:hypothetical protein